MSNDPAERPVLKAPDPAPALKEWLQANGLGSAVEAGFETKALYSLATGRPNLPPMPAQVLFQWETMLDHDRRMWEQSVAGFIVEARKAGTPDETIRRALLLDEHVDLSEHADQLRRSVRARTEHRHQAGYVWPEEFPDSDQRTE